jgi:hypothetical protein
LQRLGGEALAAFADAGVEIDAVFVGQFVEPLFIEIYEAEIFHGWLRNLMG